MNDPRVPSYLWSGITLGAAVVVLLGLIALMCASAWSV